MTAPDRRCPVCNYKRRRAPWHVREAQRAYLLDRISWEMRLEVACNGHLGGDEERDFRRENPPPTFKPYLAAINARQRNLQEDAA